MQKNLTWYKFYFPGEEKHINKVNHTETYEDLEELLQNYLKATNGRDQELTKETQVRYN